MKANMKVILFVMSLCFLSGCATIQPPSVLAESKPVQTSSVKPTKLLIVIDTSHAKTIDRFSGQAGRTLVEMVKAQGLVSESLVHSSPLPYKLPDSGFSHVLVEKMIRFTIVNGQYTYYRDRIWEANLFEYDSDSKKLIFSQSYLSDGIICVGGTMGSVGNESDCKTKYIDHLLGHLTSIKITPNQLNKN
jgi:hypothetical protein